MRESEGGGVLMCCLPFGHFTGAHASLSSRRGGERERDEWGRERVEKAGQAYREEGGDILHGDCDMKERGRSGVIGVRERKTERRRYGEKEIRREGNTDRRR